MAGLRRLTLDDVDDALALSTASNWNQTADDWRRALTVPGTAGWGIERGGRIVSTTTAILYGDTLAWIGMVLTAEAYRGQGLASELMKVALEWLDGCETVKLDATAQGAPLYRRFGFEDECEIVRYVGRPLETLDIDSSGRRGPDAFDADRSELLKALGESACLPDGSFAYGRPGRVLPFFGPCVGDGQLLHWFAAKHSGEFMFDRIGDAPEGFQEVRTLMRMFRGKPLPTSPRQFAFAGFEFG